MINRNMFHVQVLTKGIMDYTLYDKLERKIHEQNDKLGRRIDERNERQIKELKEIISKKKV